MEVPSTNIKIVDYENVNVVRQACNRGTKGVIPVAGSKIWTSTTPYVDGMEVTSGASGYMGEIRNLTGAVEGWIDSVTKYKWSNDFNKKIEEYTAGDTILNDYEVEEKEGTNANNDNNSWGAGWRGSGTKIGGDEHYHTPKSLTTWKTGTSDHNMTARYKDTGLFIPIGIRIQPHKYGSWEAYSPTVIRFRLWHKGTKDPKWCKNIVLGKFKQDEVKTILLPPKIRKEFSDEEGNGDCDHFYVYTRHGYDTHHTAFRINFLVGQRGTGKKCVEKSWTATSPHRPIDCSTSLTGEKRSENSPSWTSKSNCWVGGPGCGDWESTSQSWKQRTVTITTWKDKTVNAPSYGGKNDCVAETDLQKKTSTRYEEKDVKSCGSENCNGSSCSHCPGRPTCYRGSTATWKCNPGGSTGWTWDRIFGS
jgi:hypothetical protein